MKGGGIMEKSQRQVWTNIAVGLLGLIVGVDNLLRWHVNNADGKSLILGTVCAFLAVAWLLFSVAKK